MAILIIRVNYKKSKKKASSIVNKTKTAVKEVYDSVDWGEVYVRNTMGETALSTYSELIKKGYDTNSAIGYSYLADKMSTPLSEVRASTKNYSDQPEWYQNYKLKKTIEKNYNVKEKKDT